MGISLLVGAKLSMAPITYLTGWIIDAAGNNYHMIFWVLAIVSLLFVTRGEARDG